MYKFFLLPISFLLQTTLSAKCCDQLIQKPENNAKVTIDQGFIFKTDYLYWNAYEDGLSYAQAIKVNITNFNNIDAKTKILEPDSSWASGFQAGIGYIFPQRSQWDLMLNWTYFHSKSASSKSLDPATIATDELRPTWVPFLLGTTSYNANANWMLNYNLLDLMLGKEFSLGKWLAFHPKTGIRSGWIHQKYQAFYEGFAFDGANTVLLPTTSFVAKWRYDGIGIRFGTDAEWRLHPKFSLIANSFASILYGRLYMNTFVNGAFFPAPAIFITETINISNKHHRMRSAMETELGFRYQTFFYNETKRFSLSAYYGFSYWFNQNALINEMVVINGQGALVTDLPIVGDLQLQGLKIGLELDF